MGLLVVVVLGVGAITIVRALFSTGSNGVSSNSSVTVKDAIDPVYVCPYDWSNLYLNTDGRYVYTVNGTVKSCLGIDVSVHNGTIDWSAVANDGISFAYVRVGYRGSSAGNVSADDTFRTNLSDAQAAGLDVGVYFYSQAISEDEAREEADFAISQLAGTKLQLPVVFDLERQGGNGRPDSLSDEEVTAIANAFCARVESAGYTAMIYGSASDIERYDLTSISANLWVAQYGTLTPTSDFRYVMWQYSTDGSVAGIDGTVDMDLDLSGALS